MELLSQYTARLESSGMESIQQVVTSCGLANVDFSEKGCLSSLSSPVFSLGGVTIAEMIIPEMLK